MLVTTRVVQGAFAGIMVPQVLSSVQVMFAPEERGPIFGVVGALSAIGAIAGLLLGGWLVTADVLGTGWRSIFLINVPVGILLVAATVLFVPKQPLGAPGGARPRRRRTGRTGRIPGRLPPDRRPRSPRSCRNG